MRRGVGVLPSLLALHARSGACFCLPPRTFSFIGMRAGPYAPLADGGGRAPGA